MNPTFFATQEDFRKWLAENHKKETEFLVGFYKIGSRKPSMSWSQSVDQALCFGWIDGIRKSIDEESYCIRFTPRKSTSIWSTININKVEALTKAQLMHPAGLVAFKLRKEEKSNIYAYEKEESELSEAFLNLFMSNKIAWKFFIAQAPSYKKVIKHWIMSAKQEKTRLSRLEKTIAFSTMQKRVP
jgi:uncharacterized protein YdeI (YjbR/CyaY-like superfamily)